MNITSALDSSSVSPASVFFHLYHDRNLTSLTTDGANATDFFNTTITTRITTTATTFTTTTTSTIFRLFNATRLFPLPRPAATVTPSNALLLKKYFFFKLPFNRIMRLVELFILSLTLPLYAIVLILFIELTVQRITSNATVSGGGSRSRSQRRRQRMRSLIWTSNYLLVDFLSLLYELVYVVIHLTGDLALNSLAGRFYCQLQVYLPLYLTALMAYSLTAISIYRRRHFVNLNSQAVRSTRRSFLLIAALWIMPVITSIFPAYLLTRMNILRITQHETTNECQISYTYGSTVVALYMCYRLGRRKEFRAWIGSFSTGDIACRYDLEQTRLTLWLFLMLSSHSILGNIFLLPLSISFACYLTICVDLIRMQRRFTRAFKRHVHIRKNLILQILFLFLNFAVFWLPAEIITLYTKSRLLKDTFQVTKSLNILLDPLIITGFDTRFSSAAQQLLSKWRLDEFMCFLGPSRANNSSSASIQLVSTRTGTTIKRLRQSTLRRSIRRKAPQQTQPTVTWNIADDDDITVLESNSNHLPTVNEQRAKPQIKSTIGRKQQPLQRPRPRRQPQQPQQQQSNSTGNRSESANRRARPAQTRRKTTDNHQITSHV